MFGFLFCFSIVYSVSSFLRFMFSKIMPLCHISHSKLPDEMKFNRVRLTEHQRTRQQGMTVFISTRCVSRELNRRFILITYGKTSGDIYFVSLLGF